MFAHSRREFKKQIDKNDLTGALWINNWMEKLEVAIRKIVERITIISAEEKDILFIFLRTFVRDFILAWTVRGGVGFLSQLGKLLSAKGFTSMAMNCFDSLISLIELC